MGGLALGLGLGLQPLTPKQGVGTNPALLFADGRPGAYFDFSQDALPLIFGATAGETEMTEGGLIGLVLGKRALNPLGALGPEMVPDPDFNSATGWTLPAGFAISGGALNLSNPANNALASYPLVGGKGKVYRTETTINPFTSGNVRLSLRGSTAFTVAQFAATAAALVRYAPNTVDFTSFEFQARAANCVLSVDRISIKEVPARAAVQATTASRPTWYSALGGHLANDGTKVLTANFTTAFTADILILNLDGSVTELLSQSITATFNLPSVSMKGCVIAAMSDAERKAVKAWMATRGPFLVAEASKPSSATLAYAPPAQTSPVTLDLQYAGLTPTISLSAGVDYIVKLPPYIVDRPQIILSGGRDVRVIGGALRGSAPAGVTRTVLKVQGMTRCFLEGLLIDGNGQYGLDGVEASDIGDLYLQNSRIDHITSGEAGMHADGFQFYGAVGRLFIDHVSIRSQYQGLFLDPQFQVDEIHVSRVDVAHTDPATAEGFAFFLRSALAVCRPAVSLSEVYVGERATGAWEEVSVWPAASQPDGCVRVGDTASFPSYPEVTGYVTRGAPPGGPFVPAGSVGVGYVPGSYAA